MTQLDTSYPSWNLIVILFPLETVLLSQIVFAFSIIFFFFFFSFFYFLMLIAFECT